jgi:DNA processing protein
MKGDTLLRLAWCGLAPRRVDSLIARHGSSRGAIDAIMSGAAGLGDHVTRAAAVTADVRREHLAALGVSFVPRSSPMYPSRLARFASAPRWLFTIGDVPRGPSIGIVGTRACTTYGSDLAWDYGAVASESGWGVVSGLARGIDHAGQTGAVAAGGRCTVVLGSGIDVVYPRQHADLLASILSGDGCVVSEFPPGTRPDGWRFPTRNRIIAGLSDVLVVVEAGATGGALITARIAIDYGIPVFAPPADIDRAASIGTNNLIRDGAFPIFDAEDLRTTLSLVTPIVDAVSSTAVAGVSR